mmetsp:Transcript_10522/g.38720  ORF Transcript_10522/g.38720 Transcript_10522/m.38720 type:complete len:434 (+) Transcript_10522:121-1422(+)
MGAVVQRKRAAQEEADAELAPQQLKKRRRKKKKAKRAPGQPDGPSDGVTKQQSPPPPTKTTKRKNKKCGNERREPQQERAARRTPAAGIDVDDAPDEEEGRAEPEGELVGRVHQGELFLVHEPTCAVYDSARDDIGRLVLRGRWDASRKAVKLFGPAAPNPVDSSTPGWPDSFPFAVAADDHCETSAEAYAHIAHVLRHLAAHLRKPPAELRIYDPYFCRGTVVQHLAALGFARVYNRKEDFYARVASGTTPPFDVLVTNPPYSEDHVERLLRFCGQCGRPWLALLPNYVYRKDYYKRALVDFPAQRPLFIVPAKRYYYWAPKGVSGQRVSSSATEGNAAPADTLAPTKKATQKKKRTHTSAQGERTSPFISFWYCELGELRSDYVKWFQSTQRDEAASQGFSLARGSMQIPLHAMDAWDPIKRKARDRERRR